MEQKPHEQMICSFDQLNAALDRAAQSAALAREAIGNSMYDSTWQIVAQQLHACCDTVPKSGRALQHLMTTADPDITLGIIAGARKLLAAHAAGPSQEGPEGIVVCASCGPHGEDRRAWEHEDAGRADPRLFYPCTTVKHVTAMFDGLIHNT